MTAKCQNVACMALLLLTMTTSTLVSAQSSFYNANPVEKWKATFKPMGEGNGIVVPDDDTVVYATSSDGYVGAMARDTGNVLWTYRPQGNALTGNGEINMAQDNSFFVYGVSEDADTLDATCRVIAFKHPTRDVLWTSPLLEGVCSGTPLISSNGKYIYLTHNSNEGKFGHFSVLSADANGNPLYSKLNAVAPHAPPGIFRNPTSGNFEGGEGNDEDVVLWAQMQTPDATEVGPGRAFAFQLPNNFQLSQGTTDLTDRVLLADVSWQTTTAPLITSKGQSLYWSVSRSQARAWVGTSNSTKFDDGSTYSQEFGRGDPPFLAPFNTPMVDNLDAPTLVCLGAADANFHCLDAKNFEIKWSKDAASLIKSQARFSTNGDRVYYTEEDGVIVSRNTADADANFKEETNRASRSNFDLSSDGAFLFYGDEQGSVTSYQLADSNLAPITPATPAPTRAPSSQAPTTASPVQPPSAVQPAPASSGTMVAYMMSILVAMSSSWLFLM